MLIWIILSALCVLSIVACFAFTAIAPTISKKVRVTDPPESTRPPAINIDEYPLQKRDTNQPLYYLYSSSTPTR